MGDPNPINLAGAPKPKPRAPAGRKFITPNDLGSGHPDDSTAGNFLQVGG
jgi:hypothetical protein